MKEESRREHELAKAHRLLSQSIGWQRDAEIAKAKLQADIDFHLDTIGRLTTENGHLRALLSDALLILELKFGKESASDALIGQIRRALEAKSGHG